MKNTGHDLSEVELRPMTRDLDQIHRDLFPRFRIAVEEMTQSWREWAEKDRGITRISATRRNFLRGGRPPAGPRGGGRGVPPCGSSSSAATPAGAASSPAAEPVDLV